MCFWMAIPFSQHLDPMRYQSVNICNITLDNIPKTSTHVVNTERIETKSRGMQHVEGGWPKEVDHTEAQDTAKFRKRLVIGGRRHVDPLRRGAHAGGHQGDAGA